MRYNCQSRLKKQFIIIANISTTQQYSFPIYPCSLILQMIMPEPITLHNRPPDLTGVIMLERFEPYKPPLLFIIIINYIPFFLCVYSPNVCGMRFYSYCCPGWRLHPRTKQCVVRKYYLFSSVFHLLNVPYRLNQKFLR